MQTQHDDLANEINETIEDIGSSPEGRIKERLQKTLHQLQQEQLQCSGKISDTEKGLETFVTEVLKLAA